MDKKMILQAKELSKTFSNESVQQHVLKNLNRVAVVRGVINDPEILFADEPTGALNSQNTENVLDILSELNAYGQSIVMVTHTIKAAERGNRVIYLADGCISDECDLGEYAGDYRDESNPDREKTLPKNRVMASASISSRPTWSAKTAASNIITTTVL